MDYTYYKKVLTYQNCIMNMDDADLTKQMYIYIMNGDENFGYRKLKTRINKLLNDDDLVTWYVNKINHQKRINHKSCWMLPEKEHPGLDNTLRLHDTSEETKTYAEFMTLNAGLGNRAPFTGYRHKHKDCQLCMCKNIKVSLNEKHMLFECQQLLQVQKS